MECREDKLGLFTKILRFTGYKRMTPFNVVVKKPDGTQLIRVERGVSIFLSKVSVYDENDNIIGGFKQKFFSIGGKFDVTDIDNNIVCTLKGKWTGWNFHFIKDEVSFAHVTKKWAGIGKELFTTADNYVINILEGVPQDNSIRQLIIGAVMVIDMVLKE
jgi:uncharacterized protein YxjI